MIFRDDDISCDADMKKLKDVHDLFIKYKVLHTVAMITKGIESNKPLLKYLKTQVNNGTMDIQVHAFNHFDFTSDPARLYLELPLATEIIEKHFKKPFILYPPWNKTDVAVERIAKSNGLAVVAKKISLTQYLKGVKGEVINFHFWAPEVKDLEAALLKYTR
jgi:hypothetical protein